jgi:two-component system cell cycle sensor histidine kinase PleC
MFSLNLQRKPQIKHHDSIARIAITESGAVAYASPAFCQMLSINDGNLGGLDAAQFVKFSNPELSLTTLRPGAHTITLNGTGRVMDFHFDWLMAADRKRYLIGSEIPESDARAIFEPAILNASPPATPKIENTDELRRLMALAQEIMIVADSSGKILRVNDRFSDVLGYGGAEINNLKINDIIHPDDRAQKTENNFEGRAITQSGEECWMEWRQSQSNNLIYCTARDVTFIKRQEKALSRREQQLREAESIGRMGRWRWAIGEESVEWSDEVCRIFGLDKNTYKPSFDAMRGFIHKSDIDRVNHALQRAMIERNDYDMEFRITRPDGEIRFIRCEGRCAVNNDDEAVALFGVMQDVTDLMKHEHELREAKESAERAYAAKSQFLANMSHELRTPLNAIIGFSEIMMRQLLGPIGTEKYLEYVKGVHHSGEHLLNIINDILVMSKIEAGKYELALEEVNVLKTVKLAVHMMEGKAMDSEIKISILPPVNENRFIVADRRAVLQVLLNLLSNAVKFSPRGSFVRVECTEGQNHIAIRVIDSGIGIPANKLASITRPFEQVSSHYSRDHEGTGLGLAITKDLVEMHGGALMIESTVNVGTIVTIRMPYDGSLKSAQG